MAGADRSTIEEVVKQLMARPARGRRERGGGVVCGELMEGQVSKLVGAELGETIRLPMAASGGAAPRA